VAVRVLVAVFAWSVYVIVAVPEPLVRFSEAHTESDDAFHWQSFRLVVIVNVSEPAPEPIVRVAGSIE
jgi:hypothetical protein